MADKDDEFIGEHGDEFSRSNEDEFAIPDNAYDDGDIEEHADEFADNFADDLSGLGDDTADATDEELQMFEEPTLSTDQRVDESDQAGSGGHDRDEYDSETKKGIGWKSWVGLGLAGVITAGGLTFFVLPSPSTSGQPQAQPSGALPRPPAQSPPAQANSSSQAPVNVQALPASQLQQGSGTAVAPPNPGQGQGGGNGDGNMLRQPGNQFDRPGYVSEIEDRLADFSGISSIVAQNATRIEDTESELATFQNNIKTEIELLEMRLAALESGESTPTEKSDTKSKASEKDGGEPEKQVAEKQIAEKQSATKTPGTEDNKPQSARNKDQSEGSDGAGFVYIVPDTPSEVRDLQSILKENGYRPGPVDGLLGGQTREAVKRLQQEHGLPITGWLSAETMMAVGHPKFYSGSYPERKRRTPKVDEPSDEWFVRGMTRSKAVVYRMDGMSYAVSVGSEIPGMGQVLDIDPSQHLVKTDHGAISKR